MSCSLIEPCLLSIVAGAWMPRASMLPNWFFAVSGAPAGMLTVMSTE
jgi:hypothetical protein